jgi:hypothetical protein
MQQLNRPSFAGERIPVGWEGTVDSDIRAFTKSSNRRSLNRSLLQDRLTERNHGSIRLPMESMKL